MITLQINMMFWTDGLQNSTRTRNASYSVKKLDELVHYINNESNIQCTFNVYDYSPDQILENSIHIPYPLSVYKRSEKINNILDLCNTDLFSIIDSDCFVDSLNYNNLIKNIEEHGVDSCFTFDVSDLEPQSSHKIIYEGAAAGNFSTTSRFPGRAGMLGALFITNTNNLKIHGGFNTEFTTWGGEDGEIYGKIWSDNQIKKIQIKTDDVKLYHLHHFCDRENINYFNSEEYVRLNY